MRKFIITACMCLVFLVTTGFEGIPNHPPRSVRVDNNELEIARGHVNGFEIKHKYGRNSDIDLGGGFEAIWNGGGDYTGHNAIDAETLEVFSSSANDAGTLLSSGTSTGGSATTLIDTGATFVSDGVAVGDIVINDTLGDHGIITAITETQITVLQMEDLAYWETGYAYRVATAASTGAFVVELYHLLDAAFEEQPNEYLILNGTTGVDTVGTYIRQDRAHIHGVSSIGQITSRQKTTTANVMMVMPAGLNTTMVAAFTVPAGKRGFIDSYYFALAGKTNANCTVRLMIRGVNDVYQVVEELAIFGAGVSYVHRTFNYPKDGITQRSDIKIMADSDTNNIAIAGGFDIILVEQ